VTEFATKLSRLHRLLDSRGLDAVALQRVSSFAWATCGGASYVNTAATFGAATLLVTRNARHLLTNNIEAGRLLTEHGLAQQGWEPHVNDWHAPQTALAQLTGGLKVGADSPLVPGAVDLTNEVAHLRAALTPEEGDRFRALGRICAEAMNAAVRAVRPGQAEQEIAARLGNETQGRGAQPIVNLIAVDERVFRYRHPVPTDKTLERYTLLVLCGRWRGLVCSISRLVHFGPLPDELRRKAEAVAAVDFAYHAATRPGATLGEIIQRGQRVYAETGFADEWRFHHQGGAAGYEPREYLGTPDSEDVVAAGQAFAWNPSIAGTKSEDTLLVGEQGNEVLTAIDDWPLLPNGRPAILEVA
jgi:antitoxin VapB